MTEVRTSASDWEALTTGVGAIVSTRDLIVAQGPDTVSFLQGQVSQDVATMAPGDVRWSMHLQPQGKVIALMRLTRLAGDAVLIDTEPGAGAAVHAALNRFRIRTKSELVLIEGRPSVLHRGPGALDLRADDSVVRSVIDATSVIDGAAVPLPAAPWEGPGFDIVGSDKIVAGQPVAEEVFEAHRVWQVVPRHGFELVESTIPVETGLVAPTVAFGKGCYVGQELVERLDSRGRQVRRLVGLDLPSAETTTVGATVSDVTGRAVGAITSVATRPDTHAGVAIALVRADVADGGTVVVDGMSTDVREPRS